MRKLLKVVMIGYIFVKSSTLHCTPLLLTSSFHCYPCVVLAYGGLIVCGYNMGWLYTVLYTVCTSSG